MHDVDQHDALELPAQLLERHVEQQPRADDESAVPILTLRCRIQNYRASLFQMGATGVPAATAPPAQGP